MLFVTARSLACWKGTLSCQNCPLVFHRFSLIFLLVFHSKLRLPGKPVQNQAQVFFSGNCMLLGLCLGAMCNAWMKHAMTSSWVIAPPPVACMTWLSGKVNPSVQVGIVHVQRILYHWRKVIPQRTNCADFVIRSETLIDYIHAHIRALIGFRQPQPTEQQTDPHESQNLSLWPRNSITVKPLQVAKKAETHTHADGIVKP